MNPAEDARKSRHLRRHGHGGRPSPFACPPHSEADAHAVVQSVASRATNEDRRFRDSLAENPTSCAVLRPLRSHEVLTPWKLYAGLAIMLRVEAGAVVMMPLHESAAPDVTETCLPFHSATRPVLPHRRRGRGASRRLRALARASTTDSGACRAQRICRTTSWSR